MRNMKFSIAVILLVSIILLAGCTSATTPNSTQTPSPTFTPTLTPSPTPPLYTVNVASKTGIGNYLVDGNGMTLYWTTNDSVGQSNITGTTLANWPVFSVSNIVVPSSFRAADFGSITRTDGAMQTTYKGWPLYYFIQDKIHTDTLGQGVDGVWFVATPAASGPTPPPTFTFVTPTAIGGGGGY